MGLDSIARNSRSTASRGVAMLAGAGGVFHVCPARGQMSRGQT